MKLDSLAALLREYQGILGALLGVLLTLIATSLLRFAGKTSCHTTKWSLHMSQPGGDAKTIEQADMLRYALEVDLFNPSDVPRGLRSFAVTIEASRGDAVATEQPYDSETRHEIAEGWSFTECDPVRIVNLSPHSFRPLSLEGLVLRKKHPSLFKPGSYVVTLTAAGPRGRKAKWVVARVTFD